MGGSRKDIKRRLGSSIKTESMLNRIFSGLCKVDCGDFNMREYLSSHKLVIWEWCSRWNWHRCCRWFSRCFIVKIFIVSVKAVVLPLFDHLKEYNILWLKAGHFSVIRISVLKGKTVAVWVYFRRWKDNDYCFIMFTLYICLWNWFIPLIAYCVVKEP